MERSGIELPVCISIKNLVKKYVRFTLGPVDLEIPEGFATALIGENGSGKTTLLDSIAGIHSFTSGAVTWFGSYTDVDTPFVRNGIGYCSSNNFFPESWTIRNVKRAMPAAFDNFSMEKFDDLCREFRLEDDSASLHPRRIQKYSDGNKMRLALAATMARSTKMLILDEPGSSLDPVMRDDLCCKFRSYLADGGGRTSILFSTHDIADMESAVDYAVFMADGKIIKEGFTEDLRARYRYVHGDASLAEKVRAKLETVYVSDCMFEGLCTTDTSDVFTAAEFADIAVEQPTLRQLSVLLLRGAEQRAAGSAA
jgi:ABC-2 type transport system ATP-binding protein